MEQTGEQQNFSFSRRLTPFNAWTLSFGGLIGYGAFVMPGTTFLKGAGVLGTLIAMQIGAFTMLIISYAYGYMAAKFQINGGQFMYAERAFGKKHGFICAWFLGLCYLSIIPMDAAALSFLFRTFYGDFFKFGYLYDISGYHVYFGEFLVAAVTLIIFAYITSKGAKLGAVIQNSMVIILIAGIILILFFSFFSDEVEPSNFEPLFYPDDRSPILQVLSLVVVAPWAFVGFDIVPQLAEEADFTHHKVKVIMDTCIVAGCAAYIALTFLAASVIPSGYPNWAVYVDNLHKHDSYGAVMTFFASYKILGFTGLFISEAAAVCGVLTGILAFYVVTSRLLYTMAREEMLPSWFTVLNKDGVPVNSILFCMIVSIFTLLTGRDAIGLTVDVASLGGAVGFGYTSLAAYKYSREENRRDVAFLGMLGFIFSVIFAVLLLVPIPGISSSLSTESYLILIIWIAMGGFFYQVGIKKELGIRNEKLEKYIYLPTRQDGGQA